MQTYRARNEERNNDVLEAIKIAGSKNAAFSVLNDNQRYVIEQHTIGGRTLKEVGADIGRHAERVRQIEDKAVRLLRYKITYKRAS